MSLFLRVLYINWTCGPGGFELECLYSLAFGLYFLALSGGSLDTNLLSTFRVAKDAFLPILRASRAEEKHLSPPLVKS